MSVDVSSAAAGPPPGQIPEATPLMSGIITPHDHDVLCGRGGASYKHAGNCTYRQLITLNKPLYVTCKKMDKIKISKGVVAAVRSQNPPGRFLEKEKSTDYWYDIGDKRAVEKTSQALREGQPKIIKKLNELTSSINAQDSKEESMNLNSADTSREPEMMISMASLEPMSSKLTSVDLANSHLADSLPSAQQLTSAFSSQCKDFPEEEEEEEEEEKEEPEQQPSADSAASSTTQSTATLISESQELFHSDTVGRSSLTLTPLQFTPNYRSISQSSVESMHSSMSSVITPLRSELKYGLDIGDDDDNNHLFHDPNSILASASAEDSIPEEPQIALEILEEFKGYDEPIDFDDEMRIKLTALKLGDGDESIGTFDPKSISSEKRSCAMSMGQACSARSLMSNISTLTGENTGSASRRSSRSRRSIRFSDFSGGVSTRSLKLSDFGVGESGRSLMSQFSAIGEQDLMDMDDQNHFDVDKNTPVMLFDVANEEKPDPPAERQFLTTKPDRRLGYMVDTRAQSKRSLLSEFGKLGDAKSNRSLLSNFTKRGSTRSLLSDFTKKGISMSNGSLMSDFSSMGGSDKSLMDLESE